MMTRSGPSSSGFCPYCGRALKPAAHFCPACGKALPRLEKHARLLSRRRISSLLIAATGGLVVLWVLTGDFRRNYLPALLGRPRAQYHVGAAYKSGRSVAQSYAKAAKWFRLAADAGLPSAQFEYGILRNYGLGESEDRIQALVFLRQAADAGIPEAQFFVGSILLERGQTEEAERWLRKAAGQRFTLAEFCLAGEYISGSRLREDYVAADVLLKDLAERGLTEAVQTREFLRASLMTGEQRAAADDWETEHPGLSSGSPAGTGRQP